MTPTTTPLEPVGSNEKKNDQRKKSRNQGKMVNIGDNPIPPTKIKKKETSNDANVQLILIKKSDGNSVCAPLGHIFFITKG